MIKKNSISNFSFNIHVAKTQNTRKDFYNLIKNKLFDLDAINYSVIQQNNFSQYISSTHDPNFISIWDTYYPKIKYQPISNSKINHLYHKLSSEELFINYLKNIILADNSINLIESLDFEKFNQSNNTRLFYNIITYRCYNMYNSTRHIVNNMPFVQDIILYFLDQTNDKLVFKIKFEVTKKVWTNEINIFTRLSAGHYGNWYCKHVKLTEFSHQLIYDTLSLISTKRFEYLERLKEKKKLSTLYSKVGNNKNYLDDYEIYLVNNGIV